MSRNNAGLSAERIITEALRIIDGQGLRRLTMRRLGDTLQVEAMAIYHHFPLGKEQLFNAIVEYVTDVTRNCESGDAPGEDGEPADDGPAEAEEEAEPAADDRPWDERLRTWAHDYRAALLRHAGALTLLINRRPESAAAMRALESHYAAFAEAGLRGPAIVDAAAALDSYVTGAVIHQVRSEGLGSPDPAAIDGRFPTVALLAQEAAPDPERSFSAGLDALLAALTRDAEPAS
ncbi:AcrR family transcriptional regulator [Lipingzhangella halophila]|uniref:AcrR family transcriptional regulator n=1 Tax=Lipingzhangella halophila TaxID=1783352 RepID=A0A7W7RHL4_9ACTN|nr:TetR/AcrR family transcriptional regulator [Lipingzhangella halophila]MBB4932062.1 AcrR family transcriptional regulator [Lipingzhangella halophila]